MKFSLMSYTFSRQPGFDFAAICRLGKELGLDGVDVVTLHNRPADEIRRLLDQHHLQAICYTFMGNAFAKPDQESFKTGITAVREAMAAAKALGAAKTMLVTPGIPGTPREITRQNYVDGLREAVKIASDAGMVLTIENFPGAASPFVTAADIMEAMAAAPGLKLTFDNGNAFTGEDPIQSFNACAAHVVHAHFKDWAVAPDGQGMRMLNGQSYLPALIGEGVVDHAGCLASMKQAGYRGHINIEYEGNTYLAAEATRRAITFLQSKVWQG
ncbi:MAG: sugar phosphate isomerase/epimerase [Verrucomicrobiae bacterium]|nr:sugar phosphate isomerase/epimerase [Verrucomicrobiae bacterium]